ncbi:MAG: hypothetical protein NXH95_03005 [Pseudomonadaceae bacterium]|nr:hypothetical protein [Pseudomonadaceae bacterium]
MAGKEKPQILDLRRSKMLAAMGVQVWHLRPAADEAAPAAARVSESVPVAEAVSLPETVTPPGTAPVPETQVPQPQARPESTPALSETPAPVPLEFQWAKGTASILLFSPVAGATSMRHAKDILRYADWRGQHSAPGPARSGEFKWPQLLDTTTGTPVRALGVFIEKHFPDAKPWFLVADDLVDELLPWLREALPDGSVEKILILNNFSGSVTDAAQKKQIWQILQQIR